MFKNEYLKVLNFRDELINLLNKYDFDLYADNKDNGDMIIDTGRQYIMSDFLRNYSISDVINNKNLIFVPLLYQNYFLSSLHSLISFLFLSY